MRRPSLSWAVETVPETLSKFSREFVMGVVLNLALIIGVIVFEWNLADIAVMYLIEIGVVYLLFCSAALFAPQPVDDLDGEAWNTEPTALQPISLLPPVYWRNITFIGQKSIFTMFVAAVVTPVLSNYDLDPGIPLSVICAVVSIIIFQLMRVWQHFIANQSYQEKSPADALTFAFAPVTELILILLYVIAPITVVLAGTAIALNIDISSRLVLLIYLIPIGMIRAWIGSLDPETDDLEINFN